MCVSFNELRTYFRGIPQTVGVFQVYLPVITLQLFEFKRSNNWEKYISNVFPEYSIITEYSKNEILLYFVKYYACMFICDLLSVCMCLIENYFNNICIVLVNNVCDRI